MTGRSRSFSGKRARQTTTQRTHRGQLQRCAAWYDRSWLDVMPSDIDKYRFYKSLNFSLSTPKLKPESETSSKLLQFSSSEPRSPFSKLKQSSFLLHRCPCTFHCCSLTWAIRSRWNSHQYHLCYPTGKDLTKRGLQQVCHIFVLQKAGKT